MESLPPELSPTGYLAEVRRILEHVEKTQTGRGRWRPEP